MHFRAKMLVTATAALLSLASMGDTWVVIVVVVAEFFWQQNIWVCKAKSSTFLGKMLAVATVTAVLLSLAYLGDSWMVVLFLWCWGKLIQVQLLLLLQELLPINFCVCKVEFTLAKFHAFWDKKNSAS
jgi:hypothetical protein